MKRTAYIYAIIGLSFLLAGCVKEDRTYCPLTVAVNADLYGEALETDARVLLYDTGEAVLQEDVSVSLSSLSTYGVRFPAYREHDYRLVGFTGRHGLQERDGVLYIPEGSSCSRFYSFTQIFDTHDREEHLYFRKEFRKDHIRIHLTIDGADASYPYGYSVTGSVDGFEILRSFRPHEGPFRCRMERHDGMTVTYECTVPRQEEFLRDLVMTAEASDGNLPRSYAIGRTLLDYNYDAFADNLEDVYLGLNTAAATMDFTVLDWTVSVDLDELVI